MKQRIVSGACLVLFVAAIVVFNHSFPLALNIVVALVSAAGVFELVKAMDLTRKWFLCGPALLAAAKAEHAQSCPDGYRCPMPAENRPEF